MVRSLLVGLTLLLACGAAQADRLITIPTGKKIPFGTIRTDAIVGMGRNTRFLGYLGIGAGQSFDAELSYQDFSPLPKVGSFDFAYNYVVPVVDITPGVSVGVQDALNRTALGRTVFLAITYRIGLMGDYNSDVPMELTIGARTRYGVFLGVMLPITTQFRLLTEHDGRRITAGLEVRPSPGLAARWLFRQNEGLFEVQLSTRF